MNASEFDVSFEDPATFENAVMETTVSEIMTHDPIVVDVDATLVSVVNQMNERHVGCVLVRRDGRLAGIFTERDVLRRVAFREGSRTWTVEQVMTSNPVTLPPTASIAYALNKMSVDGYRHVPIVDPVGVVSMKDIMGVLVDLFPESVLNLPPDPEHAIGRTAEGG